MESIQLDVLLFLVGTGFLAAFIDSVVGGGGLISLPALLFTGLPPAMALGTNKLASSMGSFTSSLTFFRSGNMNIELVKYLFFIDFIGSVLGVYTVQHIPASFLKPLVLVMLLSTAIYTFFHKDWGDKSTYGGMTKRVRVLSGLLAFALGFYDGFFGPGTGSFLIFGFLLLGFDFVSAAGNAKALNFASNIAALFSFAAFGSIEYRYGLPMGLAMIAGAYVGSHVAIRQGTTYIRPLFLTVSGLLISKQIWEILR